jgi:transcriptional regulator with XRE-family HTH domain
MTTVANLGRRIRQAREQAQVSQAELARRIGISANALCAIEAGETDPRVSRVVAIARELHMSLDALVGIDSPAKRPRTRKTAPVG